MLWISLNVCAALLAIIALRSLDRQRRLFFTNTGWSHLRRGPRRAGGADDRSHPMLSGVRDMLARVKAGRGARGLHAASAGKDMLEDFVRRHFRREHAARVVLRTMSAAGSAPPVDAGLFTPQAEAAPSPEADLPTSQPAAAPGTGPSTAQPETGRPTVSSETTERRIDRVAALQPAIDTLIVTASAAGEGIVRVDAAGRLKFPDAIARDLLQWTSGERTLSDILVGGGRQAAALLESVARQEVVEHNVSVLAGGSSQQLHVTALASRSRDGSLWGALLILRRL